MIQPLALRYYYADHENQVRGPHLLDELGALHDGGAITMDTNIVPEGDSQWRPYSTVAPLPLVVLPPAPPAAPIFVPARRSAPAPVSTTKECPYCAEEISVNAKKCKHCGEIIDLALRAAEEAKQRALAVPPPQPMVFMNAGGASSSSSSSAVAPPYYPQPIMLAPAKSGAVAALLNFLLPGLGYMYCGRVLLGVFVFALTFVLAVVTAGTIMFILTPIYVIDGFLAASRANRRLLVYR